MIQVVSLTSLLELICIIFLDCFFLIDFFYLILQYWMLKIEFCNFYLLGYLDVMLSGYRLILFIFLVIF